MKHIGKSYPIHDAQGKACGATVYAGDMQLPGMLHMALLFSPLPHGIVKSINDSKAKALNGVVEVLHCFNTTQKKFNRYRTVAGQELPEQERIFNDTVRFIGDRVAGVIAKDEATARQAVKLLEVTYEELPFSTTMQDTLTGKIDSIHPEGAVYGDVVIEIGDPSAVAKDTVSVSSSSNLSRISHITMEPHACVASYDPHLEYLTVWSPSQSVHGIRTSLAELLEIPYHKVRSVKTTMGGSFGGKQEWMLEPVAAAATMAVKKPVSLVFNRSETMLSTISRSPIEADMTTKFTSDGSLQSVEVDLNLNAGAYLGNSYDYVSALANKFFRCYKYPYVHYTGRAIITNSPVSGAFRGWTSPELAIIFEHNLNMAARQLRIDPLELRLKNIAQVNDMDIRLNQSLGTVRTKECIQTGRESFKWDEKRKEDWAFNQESQRYKRGTAISCGGHLNGYFPRLADFAGVEIRMNESGGAQVNLTLHDHGCGSVTAFKMIVAETLGIELDNIYMGEGDTAITPFDYGCFSSRTTYVIGRCAKDCGEKVLTQMEQDIAEIHKLPTGDVVAEKGRVYSKTHKDIDYTYGDAVIKIFKTLQHETYATHQHVNKHNPGVTAAHFAQVEVDTYTGFTKILDYLAVHDIGQAINREICIGQVEGAVLMGAGAVLYEEMVTKETGVTTSSLKDYHVINACEAPPMKVIFIEEQDEQGPFGAKSIGEVAHVPVAPALVGAINQALETNVCHIPLSPDRIVQLVQKQGGKQIDIDYDRQ